jgi:hypothetical protein
MHRHFITAIFLVSAAAAIGQENSQSLKDTASARIVEQVVLFPQEKMYLHADRPAYVAGEKVWFRAWPVDAVLHTPVTGQYVHVELINPMDSVVNRILVRQSGGAFSGYIPLKEDLPEGEYTVCAYTDNMLNAGEDYFFKRKILVNDPLSATVRTSVGFRSGNNDRITAEISFTDIRTGRRIFPEGLKARVNFQPAEEIKMQGDTVAYYPFRLPANSRKRVLYIETGKSKKYISVPYPEKDFDVSFFPEGGYLTEGAGCVVAFKALNNDGSPANVTGNIVDEAGKTCAVLETMHEGMGSFVITAADSMQYYAECKNEDGKEKRFRLPDVHKGAFALKVRKTERNLYVSVIRPAEARDSQLFLLLHTRGILHYLAPWDTAYDWLSFETSKFPSGVTQILLLDQDMKPLSERLVFFDSNDQADVQVNSDRENYDKRQQVTARVKVTGAKGEPARGSFSVSVTDDNDIRPDSAMNILTTLLLTSDIRGHINDPAWYFQKNNPEAARDLDLVMLTNGWRRYDIPEAIAGRYSYPAFPVKNGMEITGRVKSLVLGKPVAGGVVSAFSWKAGYFDETLSDSLGRFAFKGIEYQDSTIFVIQALDKKGKPEVELLVNNDFIPGISALPPTVSSAAEKTISEQENISSYITKADTKYTMENGMRTIYIEEVIIKGKAPEKKDYSFSYYMPKGNQPSINMIDYEQIEEMHPMSVSEIIEHIPFTTVIGGKVVIQRMSYSLNGMVPAVLVLDDMIIHDYDIDMIDPYSIERVAVLTGSQTSILGGDGAGGAIVITTRKSFIPFKTQVYNIKAVTPPGYQKPDEFYSPRYETEEDRERGPRDLRTTIYWNPDVVISPEGEATFDFYSADTPSTYTLLIQGVTSDGAVIQGKATISRK